MATTTQTVYSGYSATILGSSAFDRPGYELTAWGTTSTGGQLYTPGSQYTFNANTSLYAQWDYKPIAITYGTYLNASVYKFSATLGLQVTDSTGTIVHPTMLAKGLTNPSHVRACVDAGEGCVTVINNHGFCECNSLSYVSAAKCTVVGDSAFSGCYGLKNVSLPACQTIGSKAFYFTNLETANFPSCTSIGSSVFYYCTSLTTASLPLCSKMGNNAFYKCDLLATVYLPSISSVDSGDFTSCPAVKTATLGVTALTGVFPSAKAVLETLTLPSCKTITTTFSGYTALKSITAPMCSKINGMQGCTALSIASFPSCTATTNDAFVGCTALRELYLPNCTNVSGTVAENCPALWSVTLGTNEMKQFSSARSTLTFLNFTNLEKLTTFSNYTALEHVDMPKCTAIAGYGFSGCTALNYVSMPLCTSIATAASAKMCPFRGATQVQATLGVTILYSEVFSQASARQLTLPNGEQFYTCAMKDQKNLQYVYASKTTSVHASAFQGCTELRYISFPLCSKAESYAFAGCTYADEFSLPACTNLGSYALQGCTSVSTLSFPALTSFGAQCFMNCTALKTISMPALTSFGASAFSGCFSLKSIYIGPSTKSSNISTVFAGLVEGYTIYVPSAKLATYKTSAGWSAYSSSMSGY